MADAFTDEFHRRFGPAPPAVRASAPGRVNLIGEHTDYNHGYVMPMALDRRTMLLCRPRHDRHVALYAAEYGQTFEFDLDHLAHSQAQLWPNYPMGVAWALQEAGHKLGGMDALIAGDVPLGAGLSSSAAFEIATMMAFVGLNGLQIEPMRLAQLGQRAENEFVGMRCGLMDQFISVHGQAGHAVFFDCETLAHRTVPLDPGRVSIVVCDTGVKH